MMSKVDMETLIATYFSNMAAMNPDSWLENFAEDAISYDPVGEPPSKIQEGFREFFGQLQAVFQKLEAKTAHVFIAGNEAAVKWTMQGISKTSKTVLFEGITVFEVNEAGKIKSTRAYWNPADMIAQLKG